MSDRARDRLALSLSFCVCVGAQRMALVERVCACVEGVCGLHVECNTVGTVAASALFFALSLRLSLSLLLLSFSMYASLFHTHSLSLSCSPSPLSLLSCAFSLQCVSALRFVFVLLSFVAVNSFSLLKTQIYMPTEVGSEREGEGRGGEVEKKLHYLSHLSTSHLNMYLKNNNAPTVQK